MTVCLRPLKFSLTPTFCRNLNTVGGAISGDTFQDAVALEEVIAQDGAWREWPLTASDGDCAALVELVMENKVRNTSHFSSQEFMCDHISSTSR